MIPNRRLLVAYAAPYFAYVFIASVLKNHVSIEVNYLLRIGIVLIIIFWAKRWFFPLKGPKSPSVSCLIGCAAGIFGVLIWISLLNPFVQPDTEPPWSTTAFILRLFSAGLLVPIIEEILMRGFILRLAFQWDIARKNKEDEPLHIAMDEKSVNDVEPGAWSWRAVGISTIAFASGHHIYEWPASIAFGLLMTLLWISRKDILSCIVAHSVTNILLAIYVLQTNKWYLW